MLDVEGGFDAVRMGSDSSVGPTPPQRGDDADGRTAKGVKGKGKRKDGSKGKRRLRYSDPEGDQSCKREGSQNWRTELAATASQAKVAVVRRRD